jgi:hypothetical protein
LIPLLKRLKYKEWELDFSNRVNDVSTEAAEQLSTVDVGVPSQGEELKAGGGGNAINRPLAPEAAFSFPQPLLIDST